MVRDIRGKSTIFTGTSRRWETGNRGEEIPIAGRIVALADVYDALVTQRVYKSPWSEEMTLGYIKDQSGKHFDPEVVEAFLAIYEVIAAIRDKYQEETRPPGPATSH